MKVNTIFFSMLLLSSIFIACSSEQTPSQNIDKKLSSKMLAVTDSIDIHSHEINPDSAEAYINHYKEYIGGVNAVASSNTILGYSNSGKKLVRGAKVDLIELREILLKSEPDDELFAMLAIMPSDSTEIIFTVRHAATDSLEFFDFTYPCPTACPNL